MGTSRYLYTLVALLLILGFALTATAAAPLRIELTTQSGADGARRAEVAGPDDLDLPPLALRSAGAALHGARIMRDDAPERWREIDAARFDVAKLGDLRRTLIAVDGGGNRAWLEPAEDLILRYRPEHSGGLLSPALALTNWRSDPATLAVTARDAAGRALSLLDARGSSYDVVDGAAQIPVLASATAEILLVQLDGTERFPVEVTAVDERGAGASIFLTSPIVKVNETPIPWPAETIGAGGWTVYTSLGVPIRDRASAEGDCSTGANPSGEVDIMRGDTPFYPSTLFAFDPVNQIFFYRIRVLGDPLSNNGRTSGNGTGADPWNNPTWNLLIDTDGDGFKEFTVVLDGGSGGAGSRDISATPGFNDGDDLKIYHNNALSQCVATETVSGNVVSVAGDLVWWGNAATQTAVVPGAPTADGATWNFGRTRMVRYNATNAVWGRGFMVDFQFRISSLTNAWNGGAGGQGLVGINTPIAFGYTTSNSNSDPLQKDYASEYCYTPSCGTAFPYSDALTLSGGISQVPIIGSMTFSSIACPNAVTVGVRVADALVVNPPSTGSGVVEDSMASVRFQFYADLDFDGVEDDGSVWTDLAVNGSSLNPDTNGNLAPNGITASFNDWGVVWNTSALPNGQYLVRVIAIDDAANTATRTAGSYIVEGPASCREGIVPSWNSYADAAHTQQQEAFLNSPGSTVFHSGTLAQATSYRVAYYDANGNLVSTVAATSDSFGILSTSLALVPSSPEGTWHAVVYPGTFTPPATYNPAFNAVTNPIRANDVFVVVGPPAAPVVSSPITAGATTVTGTSTEPVGSTITVYRNGIAIGATTVQPGGTWTLTGTPALADGDSITARVTVAGFDSPLSQPVIVSGNAQDITPRPVVNSPILAGATSVSGTAVSPPGSLIDVYVDGVFVGQTTVQPGGTWTLGGLTPLVDGARIEATATATGMGTSPLSAPVYVSANAGDQTAAPVITAPIFSGATGVSGTSTEPAGTIIHVYAGGVLVGQTTVGLGGTWTLSGIGPLVTGTVLTATATDLANANGTSAPSAPVVVQPSPPIVTSPLFAGATSISGTSGEAVGSTITVYNNGVPIGTTTVQPGGTWTLTGVPPLADGDEITATVTVGATTSGPSAPVVVSANPGNVTPAPVINSPIYSGATSVSGASVAATGTEIAVFANGAYIGQAIVQTGGIWALMGLAPLPAGTVLTATATDIVNGLGTSALSAPVVVGLPPPTVSSFIVAGATVVTGISNQPPGSTITVYRNGIAIGTTTVGPAGTWTLTGAPPLADGDSITATVTVGAMTSVVSPAVIVSAVAPGDVTPAPTVSSPINAGATSVSGTSPSPAGTLIHVYANGVFLGSTTVQAGGTWTLAGVPPLAAGTVIVATATDTAAGLGTSLPSNPVIVGLPPPIINSSVLAGATSVSGTSTQPSGSLITVYRNGIAIGTTTVQPGGTWTLGPVAVLADGDVLTATVTVGGTTSVLSAPVVVSAGSGDVTPPPVVTGPIPPGSTSVTGTSVPNATIDVYVNGVFVGTTTATGGGTWTLPGIPPLPPGSVVTATATLGPAGTSVPSNPVHVGTLPDLLRSDRITSLSPPTPALSAIFVRQSPAIPALDPLGPNAVPEFGEGMRLALSGSADDDDAYLLQVTSGTLDPDTTVLNDDSRPLVFYELFDNGANTLFLTKSGSSVMISYVAN